jgi:hypothetical protein
LIPPRSTSLAPPLRFHADEMPPRRRSSSGYRGVRVRPNDTFYAEIRSSDERIGIGTFEAAHEAARVRRGRLALRPLPSLDELR